MVIFMHNGNIDIEFIKNKIYFKDKKSERFLRSDFFGAGDRGRTGTVSLPLDFESSTSANSITPAHITLLL